MDGKLTYQELFNLMRPCCKTYQRPQIPRRERHMASRAEPLDFENAEREHERKSTIECMDFTRLLQQQWPAKPSGEGFDAKYINLHDVLEAVMPYWQRIHAGSPEVKLFGSRQRNVEAIPHLGQDLFSRPGDKVGKVPFNLPRIAKPKFDEVNQRVKDKLNTHLKALPTGAKPDSTREIAELDGIIGWFLHSDCPVRSVYASDLGQIVNALKKTKKSLTSKPVVEINLDFEIAKAYTALERHYRSLVNALVIDDPRCSWLLQANLWPSMTPTSVLEYLQSNSDCAFGKAMKTKVLEYAKSIVKVQHLLRMKDALLKKDEGRFRQEYDNPGHVNWDPAVYTDWLFLEIDTNMQIRGDQVTVALEMISRSPGPQFRLADEHGAGENLSDHANGGLRACRQEDAHQAINPKALLSQTAQILQCRLGGLLGREVTHVPFSRRTPTTQQHIQEYRNLHEDTMRTTGIMLAIPEHILSFKLCGLQRVSDCKFSEAYQMIAIQRWMDQVCRDVLDKCDFTLTTRTQLIYPSGAQLAVDGHPHRWKVAEVILVTEFPVAHFLQGDVENALVQRIVDDVCAGRTSMLPIQDCTKEQRQAIHVFISREMVDQRVINMVSQLFPDVPNARKIVYLLHGLLVHGILLYCLKKRWNVQYGLHPDRDPVAVPFHAKGVPSEQAEWGHPDVAILFTCLAFYYQGLDQKQLRQSLQAVLKSDGPNTEYDQWTQTLTSLPDALRHWNIINVDDEGQVEEIWRHLRFSTAVINHFLNYFVFPLMRSSLASSFRHREKGGNRPGITTGFSGTNDNRRLLPMTIKQHDLPGLSHTNAEVLTYLLKKRNRGYILAANKCGGRFSEFELLDHLSANNMRVLIDAGAFILEMDNRSLVKAWLDRVTEAQGAVYFGSDNKAWVQYRAGKTIP
ncbi:hypothetical protein SI65_05841 [Aspergillus cristatus]|uniref:ubiquitinyl hydrolase 1 n=1 Tax=Aspergillus cristatus TaxID=573508 RepID=A0A1E3BE42_ASPCR|nr:hypothetical protein SI65_05841 [Aspergillus cristatus]